MTSRSRSLQFSLAIYGVILLLVATLLGWWVYFFSQEGALLARLFELAGDPLGSHQVAVLEAEARRRSWMLAGEGLFLGVLLLVSSLLVFRAMRREVALARQQANFVAAVTHELRSPIASARLYVDSIRLGRAEGEKQERYLRHAGEDLERLGKLVDDLLETRKISTTGVEVRPERIDVAALTRRLVERHFAVHDESGARVEVHADQPAIAQADPAALEKVLDNLIANAVKYGGEQPRVVVSVAPRADHVLIEVRDHGGGLRGVDPAAVLQPFVRGQDEMVREKPGAGLGLYLVNEYVKAHGGRFELADAEGGPGAVARVRLPLSPGAPRGPQHEDVPIATYQAPAPQAHATKPRASAPPAAKPPAGGAPPKGA